MFHGEPLFMGVITTKFGGEQIQHGLLVSPTQVLRTPRTTFPD